jgi:ferrous iron transport protein B
LRFSTSHMKILLVGNPNVGKSVVFSRLTGVRVISSNYPGTTVGYSKGAMKIGNELVDVIDVPGTYSLDPTCDAERVAREMLDSGDLVIDVADATNLERNLYLTLQLLERNLPVVIALNVWDETRHRGIDIDLDKLREALGVPIIPTVAVSGEGIKQLVEALPQARSPVHPMRTSEERWKAIGNIIGPVQKIRHRHHTWSERLADASIQPLPGGILAIAVLACIIFGVRFVSESIIGYVMDPLFDGFWGSVVLKLSDLMGGRGLLHDIVVGSIAGDKVNYVESFGLLTSGLYVPLVMVLPYILSFYLALGLLEDSGYLPRLAVMVDTLMHRLGLHGYAIIPTMLGLGCNVPGIMASRVLESRRERFIAATLISIAVPCASLQAMIIGLVGRRGGQYVLLVYTVLFLVWLALGFILRRVVKGFTPELLIEIPPYRLPSWRAVTQKLWARIRDFVAEALPVVLGAVLVVNVLYTLGVFHEIADAAAPLVTTVLGLPKESVAALAVGFLRKDIALGMLAPLNLTPGQLVVGSAVLAMFFPCIATFAVLLRELGLFGLVKSTGIMLAAALVTGGILNLILK